MGVIYLKSVRLGSVPEPDLYFSSLPAVKSLSGDGLEFNAPVTFFTGDNGTGKSTLIEAIAVAWGFNPEGGSRNFNFSTRASHSELCRYIILSRMPVRPRDGWFLRAESFYNAASRIEELDAIPAASPKIIESYGGRSMHEMSHGESFMTLILERFGGRGLYILDEPESALSPARQLALLARIKALCDADSQFIIAIHSPILLAYPGAEIYEFGESGAVLTPYRQTLSYTLMRRFLSDPESMLRELL
jgi:predicted ATPase